MMRLSTNPQTTLVNAVHTGDVEKALNRFSVVGQQLVEFECVGVINNCWLHGQQG